MLLGMFGEVFGLSNSDEKIMSSSNTLFSDLAPVIQRVDNFIHWN